MTIWPLDESLVVAILVMSDLRRFLLARQQRLARGSAIEGAVPSSSPWAGWTWVGTPKANLEPHKTLAKFNQRMPKTACDSRYLVTRVMAKFANHKQSLVLIGGGGGNRTAGSSSDSDDSRTVSRTGFEENTSKEHEQNVLPDILMTMSQIPDVNRELAELGAMFSAFRALMHKPPS